MYNKCLCSSQIMSTIKVRRVDGQIDGLNLNHDSVDISKP